MPELNGKGPLMGSDTGELSVGLCYDSFKEEKCSFGGEEKTKEICQANGGIPL